MRRAFLLFMASSVALSIASSASAPELPPPVPELRLLFDKGVAAELKLSEEQVQKFKELWAKQPRAGEREKVREWRDQARKAIDALSEPQRKRLRQLRFQQQGIDVFLVRAAGAGGPATALNQPTLRELGVDEEAKKKLAERHAEYSKARQELRRAELKDNEYRKKSDELRKTYLEKFVAALNADAKKKYEELAGPRYEGEFPRILPAFLD